MAKQAMAIAAVVLVLAFWAAPAMAKGRWARVAQVEDGDTITVSLDGKMERVRLLGIDTPELDQPGGWQAGLMLRSLLAGQSVYLKIKGRDKYERLLARVRHQGKDVAALMVASGLAWAMDKDLRHIEQAARIVGLGIWRESAVKPAKWRKGSK